MKAVYGTKGGSPDYLKVMDVETPVPREGELLIKVAYASVTRGDVILRTMPRPVLVILGTLFGFKPMDIPGIEFAGTIQATSAAAGEWMVGDRVVGTATGLRNGANAEYVCVPVSGSSGVLARIPDGVHERDAAVSAVGGMTSMQILNRVQPVRGKTVLVYGCSGSVGTFVAQIARSMGAAVIGVCSAGSMDRVADLGMIRVLDYNDDAWKDENVDIIVDAVGKLKRSRIAAARRPGAGWGSVKRPTKEVPGELADVLRLLESGEIKPVIDREITLDEVAEAHAYVATGRKKGNIAVRVESVNEDR